ncbi:MAG: hypothetical protein ABSC23_17800 [Bryobacteraceae bacterium]
MKPFRQWDRAPEISPKHRESLGIRDNLAPRSRIAPGRMLY